MTRDGALPLFDFGTAHTVHPYGFRSRRKRCCCIRGESNMYTSFTLVTECLVRRVDSVRKPRYPFFVSKRPR